MDKLWGDRGTVQININPVEDIPTFSELGIMLEDIDNPSAGGQYNDALDLELSINYKGGSMVYVTRTFYNKISLEASKLVSRRVTTEATQENFYSIIAPGDQLGQVIHQFQQWWWNAMGKNMYLVLGGLDTYFSRTGFASGRKKNQYFNLYQLYQSKTPIYDAVTDKYYIITNFSSETISKQHSLKASEPDEASLYYSMNSAIQNAMSSPELSGYKHAISVVNNSMRIKWTFRKTNLSFQEVSVPSSSTLTMQGGHINTDDAPYNIFALRYNELNMKVAQKIAEIGNEYVYDLQILPYFPRRDIVGPEGIETDLLVEDSDYFAIKQDDTEIDRLYWIPKSSDTFIIEQRIEGPQTADEIKISNETEFIRITSPNYNGTFDMSVAKNQGIDHFIVSFTYKPYSPYIQVSPNFKGLYGSDFGDARGLICNGDFSIATMTDQWQSFQIQNKNYRDIFDTKIDTMDETHRLSRISEGISMASTATAIGMGAGIMSGNPIIGAVAGAGALGGGIADMAFQESIYQKNRQSQIDVFNYELGNIKARPKSLNGISAYNVNNKFFPFIEYYSATPEEKEMLANKLKYEGMTIMSIGKMRDYVGARSEFNYIKGYLIQVGAVSDDFHMADAIGAEIERGVYL